MAISDTRTAGQIVAPGEEPLFFDDIGCLAAFMTDRREVPRGAVGYVIDHRTGDWVAAAEAVFTRVPELDTPMGSHLVAHATASSREADPDARTGTGVTVTEIFGSSVMLEGGR